MKCLRVVVVALCWLVTSSVIAQGDQLIRREIRGRHSRLSSRARPRVVDGQARARRRILLATPPERIDVGPIPEMAWRNTRRNAVASRSKPHTLTRTWTSVEIERGQQPLLAQRASSPQPEDPQPAARVPATIPLQFSQQQEPARSASKTVSIQPSVQLNYRLLGQRIAAHNLSVAAIHDRLNQQSEWDLASLESISDTLHDVRASQDLWIMYWRVLEPSKRRRLGGVVSLRPTLEKLQLRVFELQVLASVDSARVSSLGESETKARLAEIDQQIDDWITSEDDER